MTFGPHVPSHGPSPSKVMLIAEAPGVEESVKLRPLVGPSGHELRRMLSTVGMNLDDCFRTNVFSRQPSGNNLHLYCGDGARPYRHLGPMVSNPVGFMDEGHLPDLDRLQAEITNCNPHVIVALGNTACWALGLGTGINALRGSVHTFYSAGLNRQVKVVPTYHPAAVLRQWDQRVVALADLEKAHVESHSPSFSFDNTELWLNPTLDDLREFDNLHMSHARICAADIETKRGQITAISFAPTPDISLAIPFWLEGRNPNYWGSVEAEAEAWSYVIRWMQRSDLTKVFQNGLYDLQYLMHLCNPVACTEDTMLLHHSLFSELKKGLGFLGSVYANVPSWKFMRTSKREELLKRDD